VLNEITAPPAATLARFRVPALSVIAGAGVAFLMGLAIPLIDVPLLVLAVGLNVVAFGITVACMPLASGSVMSASAGFYIFLVFGGLVACGFLALGWSVGLHV
jgi:hypothetical protein